MNPSGSFKDNGMTAAFTHARMVGARRAACASTGNTSAALAVFCSATDLGFKAIIFIGTGKISYGKLAQALDHGALTVQIVGDFDDAMQRVQQVADRLGIYLVNSINPFRLEGQKTIMFRVLEALRWEVPDWIVVPGGNLGNASAFGKAFIELKHLGLIDRVPRLAVINAAGARTLDAAGRRITACAGTTACPTWARSQAYYDRLDADAAQGLDDRLGDRDQPPGEPQEVPAGAGLLRRRGARRSATRRSWTPRPRSAPAAWAASRPAPPASPARAGSARRGSSPPSDRVVCILTGHQLKDPTATVAYHSTDQETFEEVLGQPGRPPRRVRQPPGRGPQRPRRHHPDHRALFPRGRAGRVSVPGAWTIVRADFRNCRVATGPS